jgi:S-methyl-5-thioribose-1-phosphate isomerase/adenine phosphoribosyltransferase
LSRPLLTSEFVTQGHPDKIADQISDSVLERSLSWDGSAVVAVDQLALPGEYRPIRLSTVDELVAAIERLSIRGAPAIGVAAALGVALSARSHTRGGKLDAAAVRRDAERIATARPTAVNLSWGVRRVLSRMDGGADAVLGEALEMLDEDERVNRAAAHRAADLVRQRCPDRPLRLLTHCNTGDLATAGWGTALGAIRELAAGGHVEDVLVGETRPLLQGARLTAWELAAAGVPHRLCVDSAGPAAIAAGQVDCVLVGADRVAANGDVANKVGTYSLASAAARAGIPFVVVAPESTIDPELASGSGIVIEQRAAGEVTEVAGHRVAPDGTAVYNPAFDVTPAELVTAVVTEHRVIEACRPPATAAPAGLAGEIQALIRTIPDFPVPGVIYRDLCPVYAVPRLVRRIAESMAAAYRGRFDCVVAVEARGFLLGSVVSQVADRPLVLVRKPGKLPPGVTAVNYGLEYGQDTLEIQDCAVPAGAHPLVVDDVLATGGTLAAAIDLAETWGAAVCGAATVIELSGLGGRARLRPTDVFAVAQLEGRS